MFGVELKITIKEWALISEQFTEREQEQVQGAICYNSKCELFGQVHIEILNAYLQHKVWLAKLEIN